MSDLLIMFSQDKNINPQMAMSVPWQLVHTRVYTDTAQDAMLSVMVDPIKAHSDLL